MIEFNPAWRQSITEKERQEIINIYNTMAAVYEKVEHRPINSSWVATIADMAWAVWKERGK